MVDGHGSTASTGRLSLQPQLGMVMVGSQSMINSACIVIAVSLTELTGFNRSCKGQDLLEPEEHSSTDLLA
jgi:hypothetical protein